MLSVYSGILHTMPPNIPPRRYAMSEDDLLLLQEDVQVPLTKVTR